MALAPDPATPFETLLDELDADGRLVHVEHLEPRAERHRELERPLPPGLADRPDTQHLWHHQAEAIDAASVEALLSDLKECAAAGLMRAGSLFDFGVEAQERRERSSGGFGRGRLLERPRVELKA